GAVVVGWDLNGVADTAPVDLTEIASVQEAAEAVVSAHGRVDALVNCAGTITPNLSLEDVDPADFRQNFDVNVMGIVNASQALYDSLSASAAGAIVNVASQAALVCLPNQTAYSASKGAV